MAGGQRAPGSLHRTGEPWGRREQGTAGPSRASQMAGRFRVCSPGPGARWGGAHACDARWLRQPGGPCLRRSLTAPEGGSRARACECQPRRVCRGTVWALAAGPQRASSSPRRGPPWLWLLADVAGSPGAPKCPAVRSSELALPKPAALSGGTSGCPARTLLWMHRKWLHLLGVCVAWLPGRGQGRTCLEDPAALFAMVHLPRATAAQPASPLNLQARRARHLFVFQGLAFKRAKHRPAPVRSGSRQVASRLCVTRWPAHETSSLAEDAETLRVVFRLAQGGGSELCFPRFPLKINYLVVRPYAGCRSGQQPAQPPVLLTATSLSWAPLPLLPPPPPVPAICRCCVPPTAECDLRQGEDWGRRAGRPARALALQWGVG